MANHSAGLPEGELPESAVSTAPSVGSENPAVRRVPWASSLRNQISLALIFLALAFAGTVTFTLYLTDLRKHDYAILNLSGQLRVTSQAMSGQARHYLEATGNLMVGAAGTSQFARDLNLHVNTFDKIITAFKDRNLPAELTGEDEPLKCHWDDESIAQLNATAKTWEKFRKGLLGVWGGSEPNLNNNLRNTAQYLLENEKALQATATDLTKSFQRMMEKKLSTVRLVNQAAIAVSIILLLFVLVLLNRKILGPLKLTLAGFSRVSQGDFGYQVPVTTDNEIGLMTDGFNRLSERLHALFKLTDRINHGSNLSDTLSLIFEEFSGFLPLDWVGILASSPDKCSMVLDRMYSKIDVTLKEGEYFDNQDNRLDDLLREGKPLSIPDLDEYACQCPEAAFEARLAKDGLGTVVYLPLTHGPEGGMMLVFAVRESGAYTPEHLEWLSNIAGQVTQSVDRTIVMDDLVVSAVAGLAKLAESRDPETGDHLVRMSLYSVIIAKEMANSSKYCDELDTGVIRDIYRFAPMHDIGKVGIKDEILLKPGKLTQEERTEMEEHPTIGGQVLQRCEAQMNAHGHSVFQTGIEIAECHHEKFDGSGYPSGLAGESIPLSARIVAVADVFDALTSKRPYKEAWPIERAMGVLREDSGSHFDPEVIKAAEQALPRMLEVYERLKHV